eukprot:scaffold137832_cov28-Tisochrysis_lutea.AAC.3
MPCRVPRGVRWKRGRRRARAWRRALRRRARPRLRAAASKRSAWAARGMRCAAAAQGWALVREPPLRAPPVEQGGGRGRVATSDRHGR